MSHVVLAGRAGVWLGRAVWLLVIAGPLVMFSARGAHVGVDHGSADSAVLVLTAVMFALFFLRLAMAAIVWKARRRAIAVLFTALLLWIVGSSILQATPDLDALDFPAPGEGFFLAAYGLFAVFLLIDTVGTRWVGLGTTLETVVTVGGAVCLSGVLLVSPVSSKLDASGRVDDTSALVALVYPLLDLLLAAIVLADLGLRRRTWGRRSLALLAGFLIQAIADSTFVRNVAGGAYDFGLGLTLLWGLALMLIVDGACGPPDPPHEHRVGPAGAVAGPLAASAAAVLALIFSEPTVGDLYLLLPGVITLVAAAGRLSLALIQARDAAEAFRLSLTDDLTGLPNRRALLARLGSEDERRPLALLLVDLDGFKDVNDTLGHEAGDQVLRLVSTRLSTRLGPVPMVARLGGDEFAVALPTGDEAQALQAADLVREVIGHPIEVHGHTFPMGASVGVAISPPGGVRDQLLRRADIAMYQAKSSRAGSLLYDPDSDEFTTERLRMAELLRSGIPGGQLRVFYQPQVDATTRRLIGLEALVRWEHPEFGLMTPDTFLGLARQSGLMPLLTETVVQQLLADVHAWQRIGLAPQVSFNIAPPELLNGALLDRLLARIDAAGLPPHTLVLEVTEDSLLADPQRARAALEEIARHHVEVSIDDYGTGFSSLAYLRDLPVQELKLDRSFVVDVESDPRSRIIVASTTQMAAGLGLRVVAEGVEDARMAETVRELGVSMLQGWFVARPMPGDEVPRWAHTWAAGLGDGHRYGPSDGLSDAGVAQR